MNALQRFHMRVKRRNHRARALKNLLTSVGVTVPRTPIHGDMTNKTYAVDAIQRLCDAHGTDNVRLALRLLVETNAENARHLRAAVITAMTVLVTRHPDWSQLGLVLFEAMDLVDLGEQIKLATSLKTHARESDILVGLIAAELRRNLRELA